MINFGFPHDAKTIIKVIGVGGGGGNAVTHMYKEGIHNVTFALCNTDWQALDESEVPVKVCMGGLGAGNVPEKAIAAAKESEDEIRKLLSDGTRMVFITAGMGGGTGTGAGPVIAGIAKEMGILTVGIVTIPFRFEGPQKIIQALTGVEKMGKNVDALLVVNNERLRNIYRDFTFTNAFKKADDTLTIAAKSIAEIITMPGYINLDFADVDTTLRNGGVALMSNGYGQGERRLEQAIEAAFHSPLLNNNDVFSAKKILFNISFSREFEIKMDELDFVNDFMARFTSQKISVIWGTAFDESLGDQIKFTVLASGFRMDHIPEIKEKRAEDTKRKTEEEILIEIDILKRQQDEEDLIARFYDDDDRKKIRIRPVAPSSIVVLSLEEMINDELITILEEHPTYNRDPKLIARARNKPAQEINVKNPDEPTPAKKSPAANPENNAPRIKFT